ncbi:MAG: bifunctional 4-hydroxy-2-oxoglutarate aldolase/2-dehydro-3-deoxy-phosphogluconate aldolase [Porticoccaceae bacterium]
MKELLSSVPVVPVIVIDQLQDAVPLAKALVAGGLRVLEVTLRTPVAVDAIAAMVEHVPGAVVGSGTVCNAEQIEQSIAAGCQFMVSPGATDALLDAAAKASIPLLPGVASASELMRCRERGYDVVKFFPAEASGGAPALKAIAGPFADMRFCPTGGIGPANVMEYLNLKNVLCVGGSWICPSDLVAAKQWDKITELAAAAAALR